jgi:hypothetical protein
MVSSRSASDIELIVVDRFIAPHDAHLARSAFKSIGIEAVVANERVTGLTGFESFARGSIRLMVPAGDLAAAREFLEHAQKPRPARPWRPGEREACPTCHSTNTNVIAVRRLALLDWIRRRAPLLASVKRLRCRNCGEISETASV